MFPGPTSAPAPSGPRAASRPRWEAVFGYDLFVSYKRGEASGYARTLADQLIARDFTCFLDEDEAPVGYPLTDRIKAALSKTSVLLLIATPAALQSDWIKQELDIFLACRFDGHVIVVNIAQCLNRSTDNPLARLIQSLGLIWLDVRAEEFSTGVPTESTMRAIEAHFKYRRANSLRRLTTWLVISILGALVTVAAWKAVEANKNAIAEVEQRKRAEAGEVARDAAQEEANSQGLEVASRELASKAEEQLPDNPTAARELAIEAWKRKQTKYTRKAIVDAYSLPVLKLEGYTGAFSPDGRRIATVGLRSAWVWDSATGKRLTELEGSRNYDGGSVAFSPDGRRVVAGKTVVGVWDADTGKKLVELEGSRGTRAAFSPDGKRIATGIQRGYVWVWDATTGKLLTRLEGDGDFNSVAFSQDGKRVLTSAGLWNAMTGEQVVAFTHSYGGDSYEGSAAFSPDGKRAVEGAVDGSGVFDALTGKLLVKLERLYPILNVAFSPDGKRVVASSYDNTGCVWDAATGKQLVTFGALPEVSGLTSSPLGFSPDGQRVVIGSNKGIVKVWNSHTGKLVTMLVGPRSSPSIEIVVFSPDSKTVLVGYGGVAIYRIVSSEDVEKFW
jgi:TIR domain/PQQ-like domain